MKTKNLMLAILIMVGSLGFVKGQSSVCFNISSPTAIADTITNNNFKVLADFNNDGVLDTAIANYQSTYGKLFIVLGNSGNNVIINAFTDNIIDVIAYDYNNDGRIDLGTFDVSGFFKIIYNNIPKITITSTKDTICAGTLVILSGGGATSYSWSGGGSTNQLPCLRISVAVTRCTVVFD